jgi:crotonobetainyl-CoA:carnitine CoA-transferase CaiB-like acyl-CoA transferase
MKQLATITRSWLVTSAPSDPAPPHRALAGLRVIDCSTVVAGPGCARHLADFGADVIKVERPGGDGARSLGWPAGDGDDSVWWKLLARNKRCLVLDLASIAGRDHFLRLSDGAHVVVENLRAGSMEKLGLGPAELWVRNPKLVITRISGFGLDGPYARRPGFATLAEAMSGFAAGNGEPDGPPLPPPIALADEVTGLVAAFATMVALWSGVGQVVDANLLDSMLQVMGPLPSMAAMFGYDQPRLGSGLPYTVPRGTFLAGDGRWVAFSTSAEPVAARLMALIGLEGDPRFTTAAGRIANRAAVEEALQGWVGARSAEEVLAACERADVAAAPVLRMTELVADPHVLARQSMVEVDGVVMPGPAARLSATPGQVHWAGPSRPVGRDESLTWAEPVR